MLLCVRNFSKPLKETDENPQTGVTYCGPPRYVFLVDVIRKTVLRVTSAMCF